MPDLDHKMDIKSEEVEEAVGVGTVTHAPSEAMSNRIKRTFDRRLLPIVCCLYVLSYLDRGNIGNAKIAGLNVDLYLSDSQWAWVLNAFYICYVCFEWTTVLWKIFPAHIYIACLCVLWGTAAACSGAVTNLAELIVCRSLLGIFEAAFGAGAPYFLSLFYKRKELGFRVSILLGMSPLANCFASALAYGLTQIRGSLRPWQYLFIIGRIPLCSHRAASSPIANETFLEGVPTVAFSLVVYFFLADSPGSAKYLTEEEQRYAIERLQVVDRTKKSGMKWSQVFAGITDYQNYMHTLMHFCCNYSFAGLSNFLPTIVKDMGYSSIHAQGLTAPVYFAAFLLCVVVAIASDRYGKRGYIVSGFACIGVVGYALLIVGRETPIRYAGVWLAACGVYPALCINITWLLNNQGGDSKRGAGLAILATFGQCSSFMSSVGVSIGCALTALIVILSLTLHFLLERENGRRDREYGPVGSDTTVDVTEEGDKNRDFRYLT
ncbi:unnamed protein product [Clonostachys rosea]|uniref:Major facilitator superfamily (MFS) profile domain-containing protein n=1 Tax=Bionectria ochroleuca TaxID=29856 RepID=A0ABY6UDK2_BIOOC|nr:unnamed protein product [Clonostachys rosea]